MRLGLDIGTQSIGWSLYEKEDGAISDVIDAGVRIFHSGRDPKTGTSLAVDRRRARSVRRRRDRYLRRRTALSKLMAERGLFPENKVEAKKLEKLDPYELRSRGLKEELPITHFGRAIFHLNQRRGFKSNRKSDRGDNESGKIKDAVARLDHELAISGAKTLGDYLHKIRKNAFENHGVNHVPSVRTRLKVIDSNDSEKSTTGYDIYPDRRHLEEEFDKLWEAQSKFHESILTDNLREELRTIIFYQRPLKEQEVGLCLFTQEKRLPRAHPLSQRRVIYETVNSLRITSDGRNSRKLTMEQREEIIFALDNKKPTKSLSSMNFKLDTLGKVLKLSPDERFTLKTTARDSIACDPVRASLSNPERFGPNWSNLSEDEQEDLVNRIRNIESDQQHEDFVQWLVGKYGLSRERAVNTSNAPLPEFYSSLGKTATEKILEALKKEVITYSEAVEKCGWHHSDHRTGEILDELPYYGIVLDRYVTPGTGDLKDDEITRYGRIGNTTVHIALNQLRRLVNKIISVYGKPDEIVVELARELKHSTKQKRELEKRNNENKAAAIKRSQKLTELNIPDTGENRMLLRLHEELGSAIGPRLCPYSGEVISVKMLFDGSCDVDHILPYSRTLDDSISNKTLCLRSYNRKKSNKTPWEAWGDSEQWPKIEENLKNLPENKRWRFSPDAMDRFEKNEGFLKRALVDTQYLSRVAKTYLEALYTEGGHVWVIPGRMTAMLRRHWGLNSLLSDSENAKKEKDRTDHRHHAIDAVVIAATDRSLLQRISKAAAKEETVGAEIVARSTPEPWDGFRSSIKAVMERIIVSHRSDHGNLDKNKKTKGEDSTTGQLHNETAYGVIDDQFVVSRIPLLNLTKKDIEESTTGKNIRDKKLQKALEDATRGLENKDFEKALQNFSKKDGPYQGIRRVRVIERMNKSSRVEISDSNGNVYKAYKGDSNYCYEIWRMPDGKITGFVVSTFEANSNDFQKPHPAAKRLLRLFKKDMVYIEHEDQQKICIVQKFDLNSGIILSPHFEANADARNRDKNDPFKLIQMSPNTAAKSDIRRVYVNEIGSIHDPGTIFRRNLDKETK